MASPHWALQVFEIPDRTGSPSWLHNATEERSKTMNKHFLRGMATVSFYAEDVAAARDWYGKLFGTEAYFQMPNKETPAYVEFRIGDDADEFGIIDRRYAPTRMQPGPGGAI